jgi:DNA topoisomerase VI subunit B
MDFSQDSIEKKCHGRSKFTFSQSEYIANKLRGILPKKKDITTNALRKLLLKTANEYVRNFKEGNLTKKLGSTTVYDFLRRNNITAPSKFNSKKPSKTISSSSLLQPVKKQDDIWQEHSLETLRVIDYSNLSAEDIIKLQELHEGELRKIKARLGQVEGNLTESNSVEEVDHFICYNDDLGSFDINPGLRRFNSSGFFNQ